MIIKVKVKPNSKNLGIKRISDSEYIVSLKQPAREGKANLELIKLLVKHFKKEIKIIKGVRSKNKVVEIKDDN